MPCIHRFRCLKKSFGYVHCSVHHRFVLIADFVDITNHHIDVDHHNFVYFCHLESERAFLVHLPLDEVECVPLVKKQV